ncbi:MAG: TetR/AcrR family transcriptional regulator [Sphingomonas sp.]|uniref:TetR/AcrR family transcriptional regulator n=1 Tax=Sphingomonas sp. TaxID=28214 RepID=UPI002273F75D|nr:TetR/AcrR family transcriptional regulator [Sphingomonas sp.]MCX8477109.1 TetR/AcrR family transcriptional regulator [Sphingomonas sp.]
MDAAWAELASVGYSNLTFEAVARRAGTSRPVLYRRWPSKASLASTAIIRHVKLNPLVVPDLGNMRDELCLLLRKFADRSPPRQLRLLFEMSEDMVAEKMNFMDERFRDNALDRVIERAVLRGEIDARRLTPRVLRIPLSLVLHDVIVTGRQISDEAIAEIVDQVFLPLVAPLE